MRSPVLPQSQASTQRQSSPQPWLPYLTGGLLVFGVIVRALQYGANRALWADEAKLALNIVNRSYGELLQPLDYEQIAPVGFLWIEKLAVQCFGPTEYALRLFPFVSGLVSLMLFYGLACWLLLGLWVPRRRSKLFGVAQPDSSGLIGCSLFARALPQAAIALPIALTLFVCLSDLVYYASEVKQYSSDVAIALLLTLLLLWSRQQGLSGRQIFGVTLVGAIALWCSHPAVFVIVGVELSYWALAGVGAWKSRRRFASKFAGSMPEALRSDPTATPQASARRQPKIHWNRRLAMYGVWGLSFAVFYGLTIYNHPTEGTLTTSWDYTFPESWLDLDWLLNALKRFFRNPLRFPDIIDDVAIALSLVGIVVLARRSPGLLGLLLAPIGVTLVASYLQKYPFRDRLVLFLVPFFMVLLAIGVASAWDGLRPRQRRAAPKASLSLNASRSDSLGSVFSGSNASDANTSSLDSSERDSSNLDSLRAPWATIRQTFANTLGTIIGPVLVLVLLCVPLWRASQLLIAPDAFEDIRPLMAYVQTHRQPGDRLYVFQKSQYQFEFYAPSYGFQPGDYVIGADPDRVAERDFSMAKREAYRQDLKRFAGERLWFLVADTSMRDDTEFLLSLLDSLGQPQDQYRLDYPASLVVLYDLT